MWLGVVQSIAGTSDNSVVSDGVDLRTEAALGGHTIARHVGKSDGFLHQRLADEPEIAYASSFDTLAGAEQAIDAVIREHVAAIAAWAASATGRRILRLDGDAGRPVGRVLARGSSGAVATSRLRVVLRRLIHRDRSWFVLTAFPEL